MKLNDFCKEGITFYKGTNFTQSDRNRFYKLDPQDSRTVVALSRVDLIDDKGERVEHFISKTNKGHHAEQVFIEQAKDYLEKNQDLKMVSLVTLSSKSPCSECREKLTEFLTERQRKQKTKLKFTLRISDLYRENNKRDSEVKMDLQLWKTELSKSIDHFVLEAISVIDELPDYKPRKTKCDSCTKYSNECNDCLQMKKKNFNTREKRRELDDRMESHLKDINSLYTQRRITEYFPPQNTTNGEPGFEPEQPVTRIKKEDCFKTDEQETTIKQEV